MNNLKEDAIKIVQEKIKVQERKRQIIINIIPIIILIIIWVSMFIALFLFDSTKKSAIIIEVPTIHYNMNTSSCISSLETANLEISEDDIINEMYYDSIEYMARCVMAEAGDQDELGKRLVIDVILNRMDNEYFPNNIYSVIDEENQFEVVSNGMINNVIPTEDIYLLISEELESRTNTEVLYFKTGYYHSFATPLFKHQDHYFSK